MANPFYVEPVNPLQALMAFNQQYDKAKTSRLNDELGAALSTGNIDYGAAAGIAARAGNPALAVTLAKLGEERTASEQFNQFFTGGSRQPTPSAPMPAPSPAPQPAIRAIMNPSPIDATRAEVPSSARVVGDREGIAAEIYEPDRPATRPQVAQAAPPVITPNPGAERIPALIAAASNPRLSDGQRAIARSILEHTLKTSDLPENQKNYGLYRAQGGTDDFTTWDRKNRTAGATNVNTFEGLDAAQVRARIAIDQDTAKDASKKALQGRSLTPVVNQIAAIADKTPEGWAGAVSPTIIKALTGIGFNVPEGMKYVELMAALSRQVVPSVRDPGSTSNFEQQMYFGAIPSLSNSAPGRKMIVEMMRAQIARNNEISRIYREYVGKRELDAKLDELENKPVFTPEQRKAIEGAQGQPGPEGIARPQSAAERDALPPGTPYIAPDGSRRIRQQ